MYIFYKVFKEIFHQANFINPDCKVHGANMGPVGPRWAPCWPHEPCYQGTYVSDWMHVIHQHKHISSWKLQLIHEITLRMLLFSNRSFFSSMIVCIPMKGCHALNHVTIIIRITIFPSFTNWWSYILTPSCSCSVWLSNDLSVYFVFYFVVLPLCKNVVDEVVFDWNISVVDKLTYLFRGTLYVSISRVLKS